MRRPLEVKALTLRFGRSSKLILFFWGGGALHNTTLSFSDITFAEHDQYAILCLKQNKADGRIAIHHSEVQILLMLATLAPGQQHLSTSDRILSRVFFTVERPMNTQNSCSLPRLPGCGTELLNLGFECVGNDSSANSNK